MVRRPRLAACIVCTIVAALAAGADGDGDRRPVAWAEPLAVVGLPNLCRVTPALYRSAQPEEAGFAALGGLGIKAVVSLRAFHSDRDETDANGLAYQRISFKTWHAEDEDVVAFLKFVLDPAHQPVLVHCQHGADRTGTMCAIYRMVVQGWTAEAAIAEMRDGGYGFHPVWDNLLTYLRGLDVVALRRAAGVADPTTLVPAPTETDPTRAAPTAP